MPAPRPYAPLFLFALAWCTAYHGEQDTVRMAPSAIAPEDLLAVDVIQRNCALYVAVRSSAWDRPIAFGGDMDDEMVHWNMCPGGTMVACAVRISEEGEPVITGIPWPH